MLHPGNRDRPNGCLRIVRKEGVPLTELTEFTEKRSKAFTTRQNHRAHGEKTVWERERGKRGRVLT
jgi:hypothetical protein